jgi:hypothetical protein
MHTGIPVPGVLHIFFFDEDEHKMSTNFRILYGLNILDMDMYIPSMIHSGYPKGGWVDIRTPDLSDAHFAANRAWLGYSWQMGETSKKSKKGKGIGNTEWWDVIQPAYRETNDVSSTP